MHSIGDRSRKPMDSRHRRGAAGRRWRLCRVITVRAAAQADDGVLGLVDQQTWTFSVSPAPAPPAGTPFFSERNQARDVLVAEVDGAVAGYVALRPPTPLLSHAHVLELAGLAVAPQHQRRGVGERLVMAAVKEARRRRARKVSLRVLEPNRGARRLYEGCGFLVEGVLRQEFLLEGRYVDDVLMARGLVDGVP